MALHITIAKEIMLREKQRYFRHPANLPVILMVGEVEQYARISNLSEGGMAVRSGKPLRHATVIEIWFELAYGAEISGKGLVAGPAPKEWRGFCSELCMEWGAGILRPGLRRENSFCPSQRRRKDNHSNSGLELRQRSRGSPRGIA